MSQTFRVDNGDLYFSEADGRPEIIQDSRKTAQDIAEILMTPLIPDVINRSFAEFERDYGSELASIEASTPFNTAIGPALATRKVAEAIDRLQKLQRDDAASTAAERIGEVTKLDAVQLSSVGVGYYLEVATEEPDPVLRTQNMAVQLNHQIAITSFFDDNQLFRDR